MKCECYILPMGLLFNSHHSQLLTCIFTAYFVPPLKVLDLEDAMDKAAGARGSGGLGSRGFGGNGGADALVDLPPSAYPPSKWAASRSEEEATLRELAAARAAAHELEDNLRRPSQRDSRETARDRAIQEMLLEEEWEKMAQSSGGGGGAGSMRGAIKGNSEEAMIREMARERAIQDMLLEEEWEKMAQSSGGGGAAGSMRGAIKGNSEEAMMREMARERALLENDNAEQEEILLRDRSRTMGSPWPSNQYSASPSRQQPRNTMSPSGARALQSEAAACALDDPRTRRNFGGTHRQEGRKVAASEANASSDDPPMPDARDRLALFKAMRKDAELVRESTLGAPPDSSEAPSNDPRSKLANFRALRAAYGRGDL